MTLQSIEKYFARYTEPRAYPWVSEMLRDIQDEVDSRYMLLPVDADGVPIHINDRMENDERVVRIVLSDGEYEPSVYLEKLSRPRVLHEYFCHEISHFKPRTVEDVLREMVEGYNDDGTFDTPEEFIGRYAAELRDLLADDVRAHRR